MVDIHTHVLPKVDDGSPSLEISLNMLKDEVEQGVTDVICTPHYRGAFRHSPEKLRSIFSEFCDAVNKEGIPVNLYLGEEIFVGEGVKTDIFKEETLSMNGTKFVLLEFDYYKNGDVPEAVYKVKEMGYIPIIAHIERYKYLTMEDIFEIKNLGALIQVNADSVMGKVKAVDKKLIKHMFRVGLIDFVASDLHHNRKNYIKKAYEYVSKKISKDAAEVVFGYSAKKILKG